MTALPSPRAPAWPPPALVARHALASYARSGWIVADAVTVVTIYLIFFLSFDGDVTYTFGVATYALGAATLVGTALFGRRALGARMYLTLARLTDRGAYLRGVWLGTAALRVGSVALLLGLVLATGRITGTPTAGQIVAGSVGLVANLLLLAALMVLLLPPIGTRPLAIGVLGYLALALFAPHGPAWLRVAALPLWPLGQCFTLGTTGSFTLPAVLALALMALAIGAILLVAQMRLARTDLILH